MIEASTLQALAPWHAPIGMVTDGIRFWGFTAAVIGLPDAVSLIRANLRRAPLEQVIGIWAAVGLLGFFLFLAIAGLSIPLSTRIGWLGVETIGFQSLVLIFWICASTGGWAFNIARTDGDGMFDPAKLLMAGVAALSLLASVFVAFQTAIQ